MDYKDQDQVRQRARAEGANLRALGASSYQERAQELASALRAMGGVSETEDARAKAATVRKRARAEREALQRMDMELWRQQQVKLATEYREYCRRLLESGGRPVKSDDGSRWAVKPATKLVVRAAPGERFPWEAEDGDD